MSLVKDAGKTYGTGPGCTRSWGGGANADGGEREREEGSEVLL